MCKFRKINCEFLDKYPYLCGERQTQLRDRILHRYLAYTKDIRKVDGIQMIPVFLTMFL